MQCYIFFKLKCNNQNSNIRKLNLLNIFGKNKKNLIIGAIIKYSWDVIKNFFISLNNTNIENCDIVMFVGNFSEQTIEKIKSYNVTIYDIPKEFIESKHRIHNYRFKLYEDFLIKNKGKYNMVFTADVRDTIFQKDIFQFYNNYHKPFLGVFLEEWYIKKDKINKYWAKLLCDVEKIQNNKIICVGTLIATVDKFIELCNVIWKMIIEKNDFENYLDQGALNCIIYDKKLFSDCLRAQGNLGPLMTIGLSAKQYIVLDNNDNILNYVGEIPAVVHQYDRMPDIKRKINKKLERSNNIKKRNNYIKLSRKNIFNIIIIIIFCILIIYFLFYFHKKTIKLLNHKNDFRIIKIKTLKKRKI